MDAIPDAGDLFAERLDQGIGQQSQSGHFLGGGVVQLLPDALLFHARHLEHFLLQGLAGAQVAQHADKRVQALVLKLADGQVGRKDGAVLAPAVDFAADADDVPLAGLLIVGQVAVVLVVIGRRHQHFHVLPDQLAGQVAEHPLRGGVDGVDRSLRVDGDDGVDRGIDHRAQALLGLVPHSLGTLARR